MKKRLVQVIKDIKSVKIQGARNIAKAALLAYHENPTKTTKRKLISARPTEPMLVNVLNKLNNKNYKQILSHFDLAQDKINKLTLKLIKNNNIVFTHCHSTNVIRALVYAKRKGKKFQVYNTETRPLFQGRKTALELEKAGIKITMFIDSAIKQAIDKSDLIFLGADALLKAGIINKIGSSMIAEIAQDNIEKKVPVYIIADSWKYSSKLVPLEQRKLNEVWNRAPKHIRIKNPAFEFVSKKYITGIVSELGVLSYDGFLTKVKKKYNNL